MGIMKTIRHAMNYAGFRQRPKLQSLQQTAERYANMRFADSAPYSVDIEDVQVTYTTSAQPGTAAQPSGWVFNYEPFTTGRWSTEAPNVANTPQQASAEESPSSGTPADAGYDADI